MATERRNTSRFGDHLIVPREAGAAGGDVG
jgi:hypothetical protein